MQLMFKRNPYGLTAQFHYKTIKYVLGLVILFAIIFLLGNASIDSFLREDNMSLQHTYKDVLFFVDLLLCFSIYVALMIRFLRKQQAYVSYLIDTIHLMKSGNYHEQTVIKGNNELAHLAAHIDELRVTVGLDKEKEQRQQEKHLNLLTSISHDLRTPLTTLTGYLEILLDPAFKEEEKRKKYLIHCLNRSNQLQDLVESSFEHFYLSEKEYSKIELLRCNSFHNLSVIMHNCSLILQQKGFSSTVDLPHCKYSLVYDIRLMERLFDNIFMNIVRYADPSKPVEISGEIQKDTVTISVENTISSTMNQHHRTGIGLSNCKKIMLIHKGNFTYSIHEKQFVSTIIFPI